MFGTTPPSLYHHMPSKSGNSSFAMTEYDHPTPRGSEQSPPTPATTPEAEQTLSTTPTVVAELTPSTTPTFVSEEILPSTLETPIDETPKEPCISFEQDFDPTANMHDQARRLVQDRLAQGFDRSELLIEQLILREKAKVRQIPGHDDRDGPLSDIWRHAPDVQSPEFHFYTAIIFRLEQNPVLSTTRKGTPSQLPTSTGRTNNNQRARCVMF
ncbi:uncharacterized protein B0T23DRAFT_90616 [Neurospora hispaniola]|uniref:Uncharacterized protein n=1 Tax=Neurospora hispaniola TaxID=588809 RepID=A0AAJ0IDK6_9PEZI|nr:hypothetical protein B0T23DRAFT_90616 [Neurospora hispaniola]